MSQTPSVGRVTVSTAAVGRRLSCATACVCSDLWRLRNTSRYGRICVIRAPSGSSWVSLQSPPMSSSTGRLTADSEQTNSRLTSDSQQTNCRLTADSRQTQSRLRADSGQTHGRLTADSGQTHGRLTADSLQTHGRLTIDSVSRCAAPVPGEAGGRGRCGSGDPNGLSVPSVSAL